MYNKTMKKRKLGIVNEARRKAEASVIFQAMMLNPHLIVETKKRKGSRMANKRRAIEESQ
jgi:hypothetical protein